MNANSNNSGLGVKSTFARTSADGGTKPPPPPGLIPPVGAVGVVGVVPVPSMLFAMYGPPTISRRTPTTNPMAERVMLSVRNWVTIFEFLKPS